MVKSGFWTFQSIELIEDFVDRPNQEQLRKLKCNYGPSDRSDRNWTCGTAILVQRYNQISYIGQFLSSNRKLTHTYTSTCIINVAIKFTLEISIYKILLQYNIVAHCIYIRNSNYTTKQKHNGDTKTVGLL
jgi:hypothetical protein